MRSARKSSAIPKRQLTGYIIYASEVRKQVIDKNPNQAFGDISRLVGNEWKALPDEIRNKYDERALIHNKRVREKAQRDAENPSEAVDGMATPKLTKRKLAKMAKERMKQFHLSIASNLDDSLSQSSLISQEHSSSPTTPESPHVNNNSNNHQHCGNATNASSGATALKNQTPMLISSSSSSTIANNTKSTIHHAQAAAMKTIKTDRSTQTPTIRFVAPQPAKPLQHSEVFKQYIQGLKMLTM